mgnify:CR=1 FL=1
MLSPVHVTVTGAAGQIGYQLLARIASGQMLGPEQPVVIRLLEIEPAMKALQGTIMELQDCAFPLLRDYPAIEEYGAVGMSCKVVRSDGLDGAAQTVAFDAGLADAFAFPGFVPAYVRPLFCRGVGPFRWAALSGDPEDIDGLSDSLKQYENAVKAYSKDVRESWNRNLKVLKDAFAQDRLREEPRHRQHHDLLAARALLAQPDRVGHDHLLDGRLLDPLERRPRQHAVHRARQHALGAGVLERHRGLLDRAGRIDDVVLQDARPALHVADDVHHLRGAVLGAPLVAAQDGAAGRAAENSRLATGFPHAGGEHRGRRLL